MHEGLHYISCDAQTAKTNFDYLLTTPAEKDVHFVFELISDGKTFLTIYENVTATASENIILNCNNNRLSSNSSLVSICHTPTSITTGVVKIFNGISGSSSKVGGNERSEIGFILKHSAKYLFRINAPVAVDFVLRFSWYEM